MTHLHLLKPPPPHVGFYDPPGYTPPHAPPYFGCFSRLLMLLLVIGGLVLLGKLAGWWPGE